MLARILADRQLQVDMHRKSKARILAIRKKKRSYFVAWKKVYLKKRTSALLVTSNMVNVIMGIMEQNLSQD